MILLHKVDWFTSADTFSSRQVFVSVSLTVVVIFGSGTKLFVAGERVEKPVVNVYPAAPIAHQEGKSSLLCLASRMFPPVVHFSWKRLKEDGGLEDLPEVQGEQLSITVPKCSATIRQFQQQPLDAHRYRCYARHEGGTVEGKVLSAHQPTQPPTTPETSPSPTASDTSRPLSGPAAAVFQSQCRVKLLCLLYTVLIVKSLLYCCGLSLLMILTNKGASTSCTHAD